MKNQQNTTINEQNTPDIEQNTLRIAPPQTSFAEQILPQIIQTLQKDEQSRRDLGEFAKKQLGIDISPYIDSMLKTTTHKRFLDTTSMKEPALDLAKTVIEMYFEDGYDMFQIAQEMHLKIGIVKGYIAQKDHWVALAAKKAVTAIVVDSKIVELPWLVRQYMRIRGLI